MGLPPETTSDDTKHSIVMGYPHMQCPSPGTYPAPAPAPAYASSFQNQYLSPQAYQHHGHGPPSSPYPHDDSKHGGPNSYPHQPYNDGGYYQPPPPYNHLDDPSDNNSFGRVMLILLIVLVASMCMMSLVMWYLFGTYIPDFSVSSLRVTNFSATNTTLNGTWDVDVCISNINQDLSIQFQGVVASIFYEDVLLGVSTLPPFQAMKMERSHLNFSMMAEQTTSDQKLQGWVLPALSQDQRDGAAIFSLRLALRANFSSDESVYKQEGLRVLCENLLMNFTSPDEGVMAPGFGSACLIRFIED